MIDGPGIAEQYSDAIAAGMARDVVGAVAFAGREEVIGYLLWRVLHGGDIAAIPALRDELLGAVTARMRKRNWRDDEQSDAPQITDRVLRWYLIHVCPACQGRRYLPVPGVDRVLSDHPCPACHGNGRLAIERAVPASRVGRAKEIAGILDVADSRMLDQVWRARRA